MSEITDFIEKAIAQTPEQYHDILRDYGRSMYEMSLDDAHAIAAMALRNKMGDAWKQFVLSMNKEDRAELEKRNNENLRRILEADRSMINDRRELLTRIVSLSMYLVARPR